MSAPLEVFCCYAREDQEMLTQLRKHLAPLVRQSQITIWCDTNLSAGAEWEKELHQHLESADIILLLISPDFIASDYCYSTEMERALARHHEGSAQVIPILLRSAFWQNTPVAKLQLIPTNARPVTNWPDRDDVFHDITVQINQVVSELQARRAQILANRYGESQQKRVEQQPEKISENKHDEGKQMYVERQPEKALDGLPVPFFDPVKPKLLRTLTGHTRDVGVVTFSPDGTILASGSDDRAIKLWGLKPITD